MLIVDPMNVSQNKTTVLETVASLVGVYYIIADYSKQKRYTETECR